MAKRRRLKQPEEVRIYKTKCSSCGAVQLVSDWFLGPEARAILRHISVGEYFQYFCVGECDESMIQVVEIVKEKIKDFEDEVVEEDDDELTKMN